MRPRNAAAYESRVAITRSGGTRRQETATPLPTMISASESFRATTTSSKRTPPTETPTASSCFRRQRIRASAGTSWSATRRSSCRMARRPGRASTSGTNHPEAQQRSTRTSVSPRSTRHALALLQARFQESRDHDRLHSTPARISQTWLRGARCRGGGECSGASQQVSNIGAGRRTAPRSGQPGSTPRAVQRGPWQGAARSAALADVTGVRRCCPVGSATRSRCADRYGAPRLRRLVQHVSWGLAREMAIDTPDRPARHSVLGSTSRARHAVSVQLACDVRPPRRRDIDAGG